MKFFAVVADLFCADGRTDKETAVTLVMVAFRNFAKRDWKLNQCNRLSGWASNPRPSERHATVRVCRGPGLRPGSTPSLFTEHAKLSDAYVWGHETTLMLGDMTWRLCLGTWHDAYVWGHDTTLMFGDMTWRLCLGTWHYACIWGITWRLCLGTWYDVYVWGQDMTFRDMLGAW